MKKLLLLPLVLLSLVSCTSEDYRTTIDAARLGYDIYREYDRPPAYTYPIY